MLKNRVDVGIFDDVFEMGGCSKNADLSGDFAVLCAVCILSLQSSLPLPCMSQRASCRPALKDYTMVPLSSGVS